MTPSRPRFRSVGLKRAFGRLLRDDAAASAVFFAITISSTVGMVGLGVETGLWFAERRQYQTAADAGAIAGALQMANQLTGGSTASLDKTETGAAWKESIRNGASTFVLNTSVQQLSSPTRAHVEVSEAKSTILASLALPSVTINTVAEASVTSLGQPCINALGGTGTVITVQGSATLSAPNCVLTSNSTASGTSTGNSDPASVAIQGGNNTTVDVAQIYSVGSVVQGGTPQVEAPLSTMNSTSAMNDPFSSVTAPTVAAAPTISSTCNPQVAISASGGAITPGILCKFGQNGSNGTSSTQSGAVTLVAHTWTLTGGTTTSYVKGNLAIGSGNTVSALTTNGTIYINGDLSIASGATVAMTGNIYVDGNVSVSGHLTLNGSLTISNSTNQSHNFSISGGNVTVNSGTITIRNGNFSISSGGTLTGSSATIALSGTTGYFDINSNSTVSLTAPTSGTYAGIALYQDPAYTGNNANNIGGGNSTIVGAIYAKSGTVNFGGNGTSACTVIVAKVVNFTGNSSLDTSGCANFGITLPTFYKVSLTL